MGAFVDSVSSATLATPSTNLSDAIDSIITRLTADSNVTILDSNGGNAVLFEFAAPSHGNNCRVNIRHDGAGKIKIGLDPDSNWTSCGDTTTPPSPSSANANELTWAFPISDQVILFSTAEDSFWMVNTSNSKTRTPDIIGAGLIWQKADAEWTEIGYGIAAGELESSLSQGFLNSGSSTSYGVSEIYIGGSWKPIRAAVTVNSSLNARYAAGDFRAVPVPIYSDDWGSSGQSFYVGSIRFFKVTPYDLLAPPRTTFDLVDADTGDPKISLLIVDDDGGNTNISVLWQYKVKAG